MQEALIFEPHPYHYIVIPGIIQYFNNLNFEVTVLIRKCGDYDLVTSNKELKFRTIYYSDKSLQEDLKPLENIFFDVLFYSSIEYFKGEERLIASTLLKDSKIKFEVSMGIQHNPLLIPTLGTANFVRYKRLFALSEAYYHGTEIPIVIPTYLRAYEKKTKNDRTILYIGRSNNLDVILSQVSAAKMQGYSDYKVYVVGVSRKEAIWQRRKEIVKNIVAKLKRKSIKYVYPMSIYKRITFCGVVSFSTLFQYAQDCSFIGMAFDATSQYDFYNGKTTGALIWALSLDKPCVVQDEYAKAYGLDKKCSVVCEKNDIKNGIVEAIQVKNEAYCEMVHEMHNKQIYFAKLSMMNLKSSIEFES